MKSVGRNGIHCILTDFILKQPLVHNELARDIEDNGLNIYAFTIITDKAGIEALKDVGEIVGISVSALRYE